MDTQEILEKVEVLVAPVLANLGYDLIERELINESGRWVLRLFIDKNGGVTIDDCKQTSRSIEDLLEVEDVVPVRYNLEVSSPGIFRPLRRREDFTEFFGERASIRAKKALEDRRNFVGLLGGLEGDDVIIVVDGQRYRVPFAMIERARLEPEDIFNKGKKEKGGRR